MKCSTRTAAPPPSPQRTALTVYAGCCGRREVSLSFWNGARTRTDEKVPIYAVKEGERNAETVENDGPNSSGHCRLTLSARLNC